VGYEPRPPSLLCGWTTRPTGSLLVQKAAPVVRGWNPATVPRAGYLMAMACHPIIGQVANRTGDDAGEPGEPPRAAQVARHPERRLRADGDRLRAVRLLLDPDDRVDALELGVAPPRRPADGAVERGKPQRSLPVAREDELDDRATEAAGSVI